MSVEVVTTESKELTARIKFELNVHDLDTLRPRKMPYFGLCPPERTQRTISSIGFNLGVNGACVLPKDAHQDLFNTGILHKSFSLGWTGTKALEVEFTGGSGEKWYRVTFIYDTKNKTLVRSVYRIMQKRWLSEWRLMNDHKTWEVSKEPSQVE
jgi:hypothetical protein